jgi:tRNA pseudouridine38-40 synthase
MKSRYFIELSFKGTAYHGWQRQPNAKTVQDEVDRALVMLLKEQVTTVGAGRTDAGVHARFFTAHFESREYNPGSASRFLYHINSILPDDIFIMDIYPVTGTAHARFSALSRTYEYRVIRRKDPFDAGLSWHYPFPLDLERMNQASAVLLQTDDFRSFCKVHSQAKTTRCRVTSAGWTAEGNSIVFIIEADRFLRNMVRAIVGTLIEVGRGKITVEEFRKIILAADRRAAHGSAPATGLTLIKITYPDSVKKIESVNIY